MHRALQLIRHAAINRLMTGNLTFAVESIADGNDLEMCFRIWGHIVLTALIDNLQKSRRQKFGKSAVLSVP